MAYQPNIIMDNIHLKPHKLQLAKQRTSEITFQPSSIEEIIKIMKVTNHNHTGQDLATENKWKAQA